MKNEHKNKPVRNFFYAFFCVVVAFAFTGFSYTWYFENTPYRMEIFFACSLILILAVLFGIIKPLFKLSKKR